MKYRKALKILRKEKGIIFDSDDVHHVCERLEMCGVSLPISIKTRIQILKWIVDVAKAELGIFPKENLKKVSKTKRKRNPSKSHQFFVSMQWRDLRDVVIEKYGKRCMRCNYMGRSCHVDHIFPRSRYPHLELDFGNLQVLCNDCNVKKSNKFFCDFRKVSDNEKLITAKKANERFCLVTTRIHSMED